MDPYTQKQLEKFNQPYIELVQNTREMSGKISCLISDMRYYTDSDINNCRNHVIAIQENIDSFKNIRLSLENYQMLNEEYKVEYEKIHQEVIDLRAEFDALFDTLQTEQPTLETVKTLVKMKQQCEGYKGEDENHCLYCSLNYDDNHFVYLLEQDIFDTLQNILGISRGLFE